MTLSVGIIAGIATVSIVACALIAWGVYFVIKKRRQKVEYLQRCEKLWKKYEGRNRKSQVIAKIPEAKASFVHSHLPGQFFTSRELNQKTEFVIPGKNDPGDGDEEQLKSIVSMQAPIEPDSLDLRFYNGHHQGETSDLDAESRTRPPQVFLSVEYMEDTKLVRVFIDQAKFLRPASDRDNCNPYCTVAVVPGYPEQKSGIKWKTVNPFFGKAFNFSFARSELKEKTLQLKFYNFDQHSRHECIGIVQQKLEDFSFDSKTNLWRKVLPPATYGDQTPEKAGELLIRLGYATQEEKLTVVVLKARSLKEVGDGKDRVLPDPYVRVTVLREGSKLKKKKTSTKRSTCYATYNQVIHFPIPLHVLPLIEIQFHVVHETKDMMTGVEKKELIGFLEIGSHSTGDELQHWKDLMSIRKRARWHYLTTYDESNIPSTSRQCSSVDEPPAPEDDSSLLKNVT